MAQPFFLDGLAGPLAGALRPAVNSARIVERLGFEPVESASRGMILGGSRFDGQERTRFTLDLVDLDAVDYIPADEFDLAAIQRVIAREVARELPGLKRLELSFLPHGMAIHPQHPWLSAWFEKWGAGAAFLDISAGRLITRIAPLSGHEFYGHGAFTEDGRSLLCVETNLETKAGVISIRDASLGAPGELFKPIGQFPSYGTKPHDCVLLAGGAVFAVTNGGGVVGGDDLASVCLIEAGSGKLLERIPMMDERRNAGHIDFDSLGNYALVSAPREGLPVTALGGLSVGRRGQALRAITEPSAVYQRMLGESLSVAIDEQAGQVWVTNPHGNLASVWRQADNQCAGALHLPSARGVSLSLDERLMCVSYARSVQAAQPVSLAGLQLFEPMSLRRAPLQPAVIRVLGGSHLYAWAEPKRAPADAAARVA